MATLPKPRYPSRPHAAEVWPVEGIPELGADAAPSISRESSLLGLQTEIPPLDPQPATSEPRLMAGVAARLERLGEPLRRVGQWWLARDLRRCQLPLLVLALGVWAITARVAWQSQESATPLLLERISQMHEARARAASGSIAAPVAVPASADNTPARTTAVDTRVTKAAPSPPTVPLQPAVELEQGVQRESRGLASVLASSIESWFSPIPASRERVEGNPQRRVWVDMKTGLYYCPGAYHFGYGGAGRGRVMIQKDAEYEYFQPATGAPCE